MNKRRVFKSIYFEDAKFHGKKRGDVTLSFNSDEGLYDKIKHLSSSEIKKIVGVYQYKELLEATGKEDRSSSNFIKHRLRVYFEDE